MYSELGLITNSILIGIMISFVAVTSPTVFKTLDSKNSQKFLRFIFPRLFNFCTIISAFTVFMFYLGEFFFGTISSIAVTMAFLINTYVLTPKINEMRDLSLAGDTRAKKSFKNLHLASVVLYLFNILCAIFVIIIFYTF